MKPKELLLPVDFHAMSMKLFPSSLLDYDKALRGEVRPVGMPQFKKCVESSEPINQQKTPSRGVGIR